MTHTNLVIDAGFDRALFDADGDSVRHLVVRIRGQRRRDRASAPRPNNIALAIDISASMTGRKIEAAKRAALGLVERLRDGDRLSLVTFAVRAEPLVEAAVIAPDTRVRIAARIAQLQVEGGTNLSDGWFTAADLAAMASELDPRLTPRVILLTDGQANHGICDPRQLIDHARQLARRGVLTSTLGIGNDYDEQLLRGIAEQGEGRLHDAELAEDIATLLHGELDDIGSTAVERAVLELGVPAGVGITRLGRDGERIGGGLAAGQQTFSVGSVQDGSERIVVLRVACPRAKPGEALSFTVAVRGDAPDSGAPVAASAPGVALVAAPGRDSNAQPRDARLALIVAQIWSADLVANVARVNRLRDYAGAAELAEDGLADFRRYVEGLAGAEAMVSQLEVLARHAARPLSPRMSKSMVSQSVLSMESRHLRSVVSDHWSDRLARGD